MDSYGSHFYTFQACHNQSSVKDQFKPVLNQSIDILHCWWTMWQLQPKVQLPSVWFSWVHGLFFVLCTGLSNTIYLPCCLAISWAASWYELHASPIALVKSMNFCCCVSFCVSDGSIYLSLMILLVPSAVGIQDSFLNYFSCSNSDRAMSMGKYPNMMTHRKWVKEENATNHNLPAVHHFLLTLSSTQHPKNYCLEYVYKCSAQFS